MRRLLSLTLIFSLMSMFCTPAVFAQEIGDVGSKEEKEAETSPGEPIEGGSWMTCHMRGKEDGGAQSTGGSMAGGIAGGLLLGLIGTGIAVLAQSKSDPPASYLFQLQEESEECSYAYLEAFRQESVSKKRSAALTGGLIGTAILVVIVVASQGS